MDWEGRAGNLITGFNFSINLNTARLGNSFQLEIFRKISFILPTTDPHEMGQTKQGGCDFFHYKTNIIGRKIDENCFKKLIASLLKIKQKIPSSECMRVSFQICT